MNPFYKRFLLLIAVLLTVAVCSSESFAQPFCVNWIGAADTEGLWDAGDAGGGEGSNWETTEAPIGNFQPSEGFNSTHRFPMAGSRFSTGQLPLCRLLMYDWPRMAGRLGR